MIPFEIYIFAVFAISSARAQSNARRTVPLITDICDRFPDNSLCKSELSIPKDFLTTGRLDDCRKYQLHYSYWCTSIGSTRTLEAKKFCDKKSLNVNTTIAPFTSAIKDRPILEIILDTDKYEASCDASSAPSITEKLTRVECARYASLAESNCVEGNELADNVKALCSLYKKSCPQKKVKPPSRQGSSKSGRDLSWLKDQNEVNLGADSLINQRMHLIENCNKNMDLYVKHCTRSNGGGDRMKTIRRQRRDLTALANPKDVDFAKICAEYRPKAQRYCKGRLKGSLKTYCEYYNAYCGKYNPAPEQERQSQHITQSIDTTLDDQFCSNFAKKCNTVSSGQDIKVYHICEDYKHTEGTFCPAYSLQKDRLMCTAYRKYCMMGAEPFMNIDGIEV